MPDAEVTRQAMHVQRRLYLNGKPCWLREFASTLRTTPRGEGWLAQWLADPNFRLQCADRVQVGSAMRLVNWEDTFKVEAEKVADEVWLKRVQDPSGRRPGSGNILRSYALFKSEVGLEAYLWRIKDAGQRRLFAALRMGVAPLRIELGRYGQRPLGGKGLPVEDRVCQVCSSGCVEDETHFVAVCPAYTQLRQRLWLKCERVAEMSDLAGRARSGIATPQEVFACLMREEKVVCDVSKFVAQAFRKREAILASKAAASARRPAHRGGNGSKVVLKVIRKRKAVLFPKLVGSATLSAGRRPRHVGAV